MYVKANFCFVFESETGAQDKVCYFIAHFLKSNQSTTRSKIILNQKWKCISFIDT